MREIVLINTAGPDRPELIAALGEVLAAGGAELLDVGQALLHEVRASSLLVRLPAAADAAALLAQLRDAGHRLGQQVHCTPLSEADYRQWLSAQGRPRHVVTLMARTLRAEQLQRVGASLARHGLSIARIERLSAPRPLELPDALGKGCLELSVLGEPGEPSALRAELLGVAQALGLDIVLQRDSVFRRSRRLAVFDMDSTLIQAEVIDELAKAAGVGARVAAITERAMRGELDFRASFKERLALLKGLPEQALAEVAATLPLSEGAETLFAGLKRLGCKTAILSGGFSYFARQLQARLGIDYVFANELQIVDGKLTGVAVEPIVDAQRKADLLRELAAREGLCLEQTIAVGDGANDLPMLALAGLGVAFHAKPLVRQSARQAISILGLDAILYLLGCRDGEADEAWRGAQASAAKS